MFQGLREFVVMIEERFGRIGPVMTKLFVVVAFGAGLTLFVNIIVVMGIWPTASFLRDISSGSDVDWRMVISTFAAIIIGGIGGMLLYIFLTRIFVLPKIRVLQSEVENTHKESELMLSESLRHLGIAEADWAEAKAFLSQVRALLPEAESDVGQSEGQNE